jgi:peptide-methionine (S)-S-oxide reductase
MSETTTADRATAVMGGGCFWCTEAVLQRIEGVLGVAPGYAGGTTPNPTYEEVCTGETGHAEVIQVTFDPRLISYEEILDIFWQAHDPTTLNRQGADEGTQYRSAIFYADNAQKAAAETSLQSARSKFKDPIVTEITPLTRFWEAEDYHHNYYNTHGTAGYCRMVISPKLKKLRLE